MPDWTRDGKLRAGWAFVVLALAFALTFGSVVLWLAHDQQRVVETAMRLQDQTMPEIVRHQRLSRNLEQLRQEGERVYAVATPQARQQALFVVTLVASHPSILDHPEARELARRVERFLSDAVRDAGSDDAKLMESYPEWQRLAARLGVLVDDVYIQGVNQAGGDLKDVLQAMEMARVKLFGAMLLVGIFLGVFLWLLHRHLIRPLQRIDRVLSRLHVDCPRPEFHDRQMAEIVSVERAIGELHDALRHNEAARQALENLANLDGLTGLTNRRCFLLQAEHELQRAQRYLRPIAVGMADLDYFKRLNDTYGHAAGDAVLRAFAVLVQESLRQTDLICRYGGEEFVFLFPESTVAEAEVLAERLRSRCADYDIRLPDERVVRVTVSIGLADAGQGSIESALKLADAALYTAKRQGRNRVVRADARPSGRPEHAEPDRQDIDQAE
ncbi:diguanylate cyclase [Azonexus sp. R2A61]|uniref:GGDEF domain-containing protein n=1 Tax=Azonexus sp. R2A61 TaxID=2744443 RepID=UPI001F298703|nr:GGDEF domain-containing protein [Azonexus sp. R2A61]